MIDASIKERSGILSHHPVLRATAINIGVALASQGLLGSFIDDIVKILNYKPLEMITKMETVITQEFDRISFYDLMFYSEVSRDLLKVFDERDAATVKRELTTQSEDTSSSSQA